MKQSWVEEFRFPAFLWRKSSVSHHTGFAITLKRSFDILLSGVGLLLSSPLWLFISLLIYLEDHGPVFFIQKRVGRWGLPFRAYKFRSMKASAGLEFPNLQACENDPRLTRVGGFLRTTAMDELPQLLNIWKGDMSFVGPRALLADEIEINRDDSDRETLNHLFRKRCAVVPGLTGMAQVFAPRDICRRKKFRYDLFYIRKQSFFFDLKLITLSFLITFRGTWERRDNKLGRVRRKYV